MKNLLVFYIASILFSCSKEKETKLSYQLTFDIDTVMVDSGGEILDLESAEFALSDDRKFLYSFNRYDHALEKIDLEELRLVEKLPFEKEGPHGTVSWVNYINMLKANVIQLSDSWTSGQFQLDGKRIANHNLLDESLQGDVLTEYEHMRANIIVPDQPWIVFALVSNWKDKTLNLRKLDFQKAAIKQYDFDPKRKIAKYSFKVPSMSKDPIITPSIDLSLEDGKLIISSNLSNELYTYDPVRDSVIAKMNHHQLTADEKTLEFPGEYASMEEMMVDYQKMGEEINFSPPVWDKEYERYYRLSYLVKWKKEKEAGVILPEVEKLALFFSIYDKNFTLVAEAPVPLSLKKMSRHFARAGMFWNEVNIEDEMGFIRLKPNLTEE